MRSTEQQIADFLEPYGEAITSFAQELRAYIKQETEPAYELVGKSGQSLNIGYGFTTTAWDCFCAIIVYRKHINISFPSGAYLTDPDKLLKGTGKRVRHLKIAAVADLQSSPSNELLLQARTRALRSPDTKPSPRKAIETVIKGSPPQTE